MLLIFLCVTPLEVVDPGHRQDHVGDESSSADHVALNVPWWIVVDV